MRLVSLFPPAAQRSAQELPLVDKQSLETCPAPGGERMLVDGHNFQHDSKVVFVEKAQGKAGGRGVVSVQLYVCVFPSLLLEKPQDCSLLLHQNTLRSARVPHVVHINALYF